MSDDAIQDLLDELDDIAAGDKVSHWTITRARGQHEAWRARVAELTSALEGRAVEVAELQKNREMDLAILRSDVSRFLELAEALGVDPLELSNGYAPLHVAIAELRERAEQAEAKVARLESAIADQVIADGLSAGGPNGNKE